jgi:amidohydrolase
MNDQPHGFNVPADLWNPIRQSIVDHKDRLIQCRRRIHATPEPSNHEHETTSLIVEALRKCGYEPQVMAGDTGIVVDIDLGAEADRFVAFRSELDCVRVNDDKPVAYASTRPGLCHACGHDAHSTILLGLAREVARHRDLIAQHDFTRNIRLIFQPAEETATGARSMIQQQALRGVEAIIALHVEPFLEVGTVALKTGPITAECRVFKVTVRGNSGHSARPFEAVDPIPAAVNLVSMFYQLAPRSMDSRYPLSLTVGAITSGETFNAIPDVAVIRGTLRAARVQDADAVRQRMEAVAQGVAQATGCRIEVGFEVSCPATNNDPAMVCRLADIAEHVIDENAVRWLDVSSLGGEDFAFYQELVPGVMMRLGAAVPEPSARMPLHSTMFDINEQALVKGVSLMTAAALCFGLADTSGNG